MWAALNTAVNHHKYILTFEGIYSITHVEEPILIISKVISNSYSLLNRCVQIWTYLNSPPTNGVKLPDTICGFRPSQCDSPQLSVEQELLLYYQNPLLSTSHPFPLSGFV